MGKIVHTYELLEQLGEGGMGVVYKARHIHFNEIYAVKRLWEWFSRDPAILKLFLNEGVTLRGLSHENIVRVHDLFNLGADYYIVMEFIEGRTLSEIIKKETGAVHQERAIRLFRQMLKGIAYIHSQPEPIIHRDIKPLNILVTADDSVKIADFGIAKALETGGGHAGTVVKGTPVYMSPEQIISPSTIDIRTDVYSLGMTFYEMLCGHTPFESNKDTTPTSVYATIMTGKVPPPTHFYPGVPDTLSDFVMKAIHKDRNQRFANTNEMLRALNNLERSSATPVPDDRMHLPPVIETRRPESGEDEKPPSPKAGKKQPKKKQNNSLMWISGITGLVVAIVGLIIGISISQRENVPASVLDTVKVETPVQTAGSMIAIPTEPSERLVFVQGGTITMGSTDGNQDERPVHQVTVGSFLIGQHEVTQQLWERVMATNPSKFKGDRLPVERVTWIEAVGFCNKLSEKEGLQPAYSGSGENITCDFNSNGYRLPTEAEWEYAARGGNKSRGYKYSGSDEVDLVAWYDGNSKKSTHYAGTLQANELGIHDMSGNVWEWCWDWYSDKYYSSSNQNNPKGPETGSDRVYRGGSWFLGGAVSRVSNRFKSYTTRRYFTLGFRLVRTR